MPMLKVNDINMYYETHGKGEPLLLITGLSWDVTSWLCQIDEFSRNYQLILMDNRGVGRTDAPDNAYSTKQMAQDTIALMDALAIEKAYVLGHSMGGAIAQHMALDQPERINRLILSSTFARSHVLTNYVLDMAIDLLNSDVALDLRAKVMLPWGFASDFLAIKENVDIIIDSYLNAPYQQQPHAFINQVRACQQHNVEQLLVNIQCPTLVLAGEFDLLIPRLLTDDLANGISHSRYEIIKKAGHNTLIEQAPEFNRLVLTFLSS